MYKKYTNKRGVPKGYVRQILLIMRLTTIILIMAIMQVSASTFAQRITLSEKNATLNQVFDRISDQSGYYFIFTSDLLKGTKPVTISVKNTELDKVLEQIFAGQPLSFSIEDKTVVVKAKQRGFFENVLDNIRAIDVRGRVLDEKGEPLVGATVAVKGKNRSVKTDQNGAFFLEDVGEGDKLVISFIGYQNREVDAASDMGSLTMVVADSELEEVKINAGYYSVTDRERTGSISKVTSLDIDKQPVNNVLAAMQANIPGVQVTQSTGIPGGGFKVEVRGQNSLIGNRNDPFYIINGVPFASTGLGGSRDNTATKGVNPLASINPNDIESIEVLKDADATAIYGSRGANGVVLITTKKGNQGKVMTYFSAAQGISRVAKKLDFMNTEEYIAMREEALVNSKMTLSPLDYDINGVWSRSDFTDWQEELIGKNAPNTTIQASISGGKENVTFLFGGSYYNEGTVFPGESNYKRGVGNFSLQYISDNKKLTTSIDANYSQINSNLFTSDLTPYIKLAPNFPALLNSEGQLNWDYSLTGVARRYFNPLSETMRPYDARTNNLISNAAISYLILDDLKIKGSIGYTTMTRNEFSSDPLFTFSPLYNYGPSRRYAYFANNENNSWIGEAQADWGKKFGNGNLNVLLGATFQQNLRDGEEVRASGFSSDVLMENINASTNIIPQRQSYLKYRYNGIYGRLNYVQNGRYILNLTGRRDGSSRFGEDNRFANFGAIGAAWIVSDEAFLKDHIAFISFAKIRSSYGITGSDMIPDYGYLELWEPQSPYQTNSSMAPSGLANPEYGWEENRKFEVAVDLGFLKNKINLSAGYYNNKSSNQLLSVPLPPSTGFTAIQDNLPATVGNTGWELVLESRNIVNSSFTWSTSINFTAPKNKLLSYPGLASSADAPNYQIGYPLSIKKLFNTSVNAETGIYQSEDYDGNGIQEFDKDNYVIKFLGRKFYGGINNSFQYKNFSLDLLIQFVKQTGTSAMQGLETPGSFSFTSGLGNQLSSMNKPWRSVGESATLQKFTNGFDGFLGHLYAKNYGTYSVENASFIRLKNLYFSYSLPTKLTERIKVRGARVFFQGQNLFTISPYKGLDPETLSSFNLPSLQVLNLGIKITL